MNSPTPNSFHLKWSRKDAAADPPSPTEHQARFQLLLRELFQFDCADLDFGIYRTMNQKRRVLDRYIDRDLPAAIDQAVRSGALATEADRARGLAEARAELIEACGRDAIAPNDDLLRYAETPIGKRYLLWLHRARHAPSAESVKRDVYNHLFAFFGRYYQDGDFVPKRRYSREEPYVVPYSGEEVHFHWANRDQYYVKGAERFGDYAYRTSSGVAVKFALRSASVEENDVKGVTRVFFPVLRDAVWDDDARTLELPFDYRPLTGAEAKRFKGSVPQEAIIEEAEAAVAEAFAAAPVAAKALLDVRPDEAEDDEEATTLFSHHAHRFARKVTSDYFIHRDLRGFLARELEFYLKSEVLNLSALSAGDEQAADAVLDKVRVIREVGGNVIDFLAQIEGFQKMLWEKRKFVVDVQYCVAVRLVPDTLLEKVLECEAQWEEWHDLGCLGAEDAPGDLMGDSPTEARRDFLQRNPGILLDTRHFGPEFATALLATLDDIDGYTDGVAIRSENWQALNLLGETHGGALPSVYIDPPYNTAASAILYKNEYKDSSWLSLMADRLALSRMLLAPSGVLCCAIDDEEVSLLRWLMQQVFPAELGTVVVRSNPAGRKSRGQLSPSHEFALFFGNSRAVPGPLPKTKTQLKGYPVSDERGRFVWTNLIRSGSNDRREDRPKLFYPIYATDAGDMRVPKLKWNEEEREYDVEEEARADETVVYPVQQLADGTRIEKNWHRGWERLEGEPDEYRVRVDRSGETQIDFKKRVDLAAVPNTWWGRNELASAVHGAKVHTAFFGSGSKQFTFPKAIRLVEDCIRVTAPDYSGTILDYFAGSGTTGHAVINLNREDDGRRKFILVEMGHHFDTVLMPRLKKVAFSPEWKAGAAVREATPEESERGPRIIKYFRLESYEDALSNIEFEEFDPEAERGLFDLDGYLLRYMLQWETKRSRTMLNVAALERPFDYRMRLRCNGEGLEEHVRIPHTFNYLLGLTVRTRRVYDDDGRRYLAYTGETRDRKRVVVIWRNTAGWTLEDRERDRDFVAGHGMTDGADEIWMNGDSLVPDANCLDPLFKQRMFAPPRV